jgi:outer membrane lipoprotein SlyB
MNTSLQAAGSPQGRRCAGKLHLVQSRSRFNRRTTTQSCIADALFTDINRAHEESAMLHPAFARIASTSIADATQRLLAMAAALTAAAVLAAAPHAHAADKPGDPAAREVRGVQLASICSVCGVVSDVRTETRDAPADPKGAIAGAVVGGLAGHGIGGGSGRTAMTVLGAVGGGVAGNAIEKKMRRVTVWTTTVVFKDGTVRSYERTRARRSSPATSSSSPTGIRREWSVDPTPMRLKRKIRRAKTSTSRPSPRRPCPRCVST